MTRRTISNTARARIFENAGGVCSICRQRIQAGQRWQVSHEVPLALGGADEPGNMRPAHYTCHRVQTAETDIPQIAKMKRREFTRKVRAQIVLRATDADGLVCCEGCGLRLGHKPFEIDHIVAEALVMDKSAPLTADDGQLLGKACCHRNGKTQDDIRMIRKADRQRDRNTGARLKSPRSLPCGRASKFKKRMDGTVAPR